MNTINNVPRELLERVKSLCEYWFVRGQQQHMSATEYKTWHALGFESSAFTELRDLLSAPSPAGVDGLKRYEVFPYLDDDVAELDICESDDGSFVKYEDAQAIIDGLRGEVDVVRSASDNYKRIAMAALNERDQQAQRIGELEGLLRDCYPGCGLTARQTQHIRQRIDAALSAGKEDAQ